MTYGDLDEISRKIQNRCGLEQPTKHTFWRDEEGKIYVKFWFDSLKLPDWLKDEDEELEDSEKRKITNTFSNNLTYTHEDNFEIVEFNTKEGWVKVLPDDQKIKIKESVQEDRKSLKEDDNTQVDEDTEVEKPAHILIYWPTRFVGGGNNKIKDANIDFLQSILKEYSKDDYKDYVKKIIIANVENSNTLLYLDGLSKLQENLDLDSLNEDSFLVGGTTGLLNFVDGGVYKEKSFIVDIPGIDYTKDNIQGVKRVEASSEFANKAKTILQLEDELIQEATQIFQEKVLKEYINNKAESKYEKWDAEYVKGQEKTPEVKSKTQTEVPKEKEELNQSYKKNLLYKVYLMEAEGEETPPNENVGEVKNQNINNDEVTDNDSLTGFGQYKSARDWYASNADSGGEAVVLTDVVNYLITLCDSRQEIVEEMTKAKNYKEKVTKETWNKLKSFGNATWGSLKDSAEQIKNEPVMGTFGVLINKSKVGKNQEGEEAEGFGQFKVTTKTVDAKPEETKVGADIGIINIVYTTLFKNCKEALNKIRDAFNISVNFTEGESSAS